MSSPSSSGRRIGYLGPAGTFAEQALLTQPDLANDVLVPMPDVIDALDGVVSGELELAFVPIENSIEGTVHSTQDALAFTHDLFIQREVILDVELCLMALPGSRLSDIKRVVTHPIPAAGCRSFIARELVKAETSTANSTADAARIIGEERTPGTAAIGTALAAKLYGLEVIATDIADHKGNQTRFVVVARDVVPEPTGHDKTTVVVYQRANVPGSLISILQEFAARRIDLSKLESRPTKTGGIGNYCFLIDAVGHIDDELMADCLRELHAKQGGVRFLGSYRAAGEHGDDVRTEAEQRWREADEWITGLRNRVER
ncbi:MAG: prephenate dehydratase [Acidimicrobiia bacterium]